MFYGYVGDARSLSDIITGLLQGRSGVLELFVNRYLLSLRVEKGSITGFRCNVDSLGDRPINPANLLIYCVAEMLSNPEGFFAFYESQESIENPLEEPLRSDELIIQATIVRKELDEIVDRIISPLATFKVSAGEKDISWLEGKNVVEAVAFSEEGIVQVLRRIKELLGEGKLDIYEFREEGTIEEAEVDYMMENIPLRQVNVIAILESLRSSGFSGIARISLPTYSIHLFYEKGEMFAVYPVSFDIFDFLLSPDKGAEISLIGLEREVVRYIALRFLGTPQVSGVSDNFIEISKLFIGLGKYRESALLVVSERGGERFIAFKEGKLLASLKEEGGRLKVVTSLRFEKPYFVSLFFYRKVSNVASVVYTFMINEIISVFMRRAPTKVMEAVLREVSKNPFITFVEGKLRMERQLSEDEENKLMNLLAFLFDVGAQELGEKKLEEELEFQLRPFRDIFRVFDADRYLKVRDLE